MANGQTQDMDTATANHRKYKCLVNILVKHKLCDIKEAIESGHVPDGTSLSDLAAAIEDAKILSEPRWAKRIRQMLDDGFAPQEKPWIPLEQMRYEIKNYRTVVSGVSGLIWSPVEMWYAMRNARSAFYFRSALTGEEYYAYVKSGRRYMAEAGSRPELIANRSIYSSSLSSSSIGAAFKTVKAAHVAPASPLISKLIDHCNF